MELLVKALKAYEELEAMFLDSDEPHLENLPKEFQEKFYECSELRNYALRSYNGSETNK